MVQPLELLAPAGNADIGIAAIDHGADAVYVGAPRFSARADAGVSVAEIARLISHAHLYYARVYVALNTILTDDEIPEALDVIREVYDLGADGLIIQDPGLLETDLPPIPLIASTQMHNDTPGKVRFLEDVGFKRVILARELSFEEIAAIRRATRVELEFFVHGALCVSYSGQCYMSQAVAGRSGNRGVCAQPCRFRYTLMNGEGKEILSDRFLLSLKDLNLMNDIPALVAAGITSFKIEGRYKEADYVKNVTAAYSRALDAFISTHPEYRRSSSGRSEIAFLPDPAKSFNRGFTRYFVFGGKEKVASMDTPNSNGDTVGLDTGLGKGYFTSDCTDLENGDGLCYFTKEKELSGFRVERVDGTKVYPNTMKHLAAGVLLYRNHCAAWTRLLNKVSGQRKIAVEMDFRHEGNTARLAVKDEDGNQAEVICNVPYEESRNPVKRREQIEKQLSSTGNTPFNVKTLHVSEPTGFYSVGFLNRIRRTLLADLQKTRIQNYPQSIMARAKNSVPYPEKKLDYRANVFNMHARRFYEHHGAQVTEPAFEALPEPSGREVMRTRHCILYELDACLKQDRPRRRFKGPLKLTDGHNTYLLKFDCGACRMSLIYVRKMRAKFKKRRIIAGPAVSGHGHKRPSCD